MTEFFSLLIAHILGNLCTSSFVHFYPVFSFSFSSLLSLPPTERRLFLPRVALFCLSAHFPNISWNTHTHTRAELQGRWGRPASWKDNQKERDKCRCSSLVWLTVVWWGGVLCCPSDSGHWWEWPLFSGHRCVIMISDKPPLSVAHLLLPLLYWRDKQNLICRNKHSMNEHQWVQSNQRNFRAAAIKISR